MINPDIKIAAVMMVRNEQHVIASCIGHLLNRLVVTRVYVVDNGSSDRTPAILRLIASRTGRVVLSFDSGSFRQDEILTDLARNAVADGADWVLPSDADEFLWLPRGVTLAGLCHLEGIGGYRLSVCNFLQVRTIQNDWSGSLTTMCVSARPHGAVHEAQALVEGDLIPFVRINYPSKLLLKGTRSLKITFGNHDAEGTAGPLVSLESGQMLHAPIRSFNDLRQRAEAGFRVAAVTPEPSQNWHLKRIAVMDQASLIREWRRNSYSPFRPAMRGSTRLDMRLCHIGFRQMSFRRHLRPD